MSEIIKNYSNGDVTVVWQPAKCIHSTICFRELPEVFDPNKRPWVNAEGANTEAIIAQVRRCPSEALSFYMRREGIKPARRKIPKGSRPHMPGYGILDAKSGSGLLPWSVAVERLTKPRNYWIATTRPDGRPHAMPVWGIWLEDRFYFSTGQHSRKARNLAANPRCVVCAEPGDHAAIVEGVTRLTTDPSLLKRFCAAYQAKYDWDMEGFAEPIYEVHPVVAFAFTSDEEEFTGSATRWEFGKV
ncbi:MAG: (4Fe-4S)-binding protein [Blastocatellia bacterium]